MSAAIEMERNGRTEEPRIDPAEVKDVLRWLRAAWEIHHDEPDLMSVSVRAQGLIRRMAQRIACLERSGEGN